MKTTYLSCADTAKLVRAALKRAFPSVKFAVRSSTYSMGASINVSWTDGPSQMAVEPIARQFKAASFDGTIDLQTSRTCWLLPDGSAITATDDGTRDSGGCFDAERNWMPHPDAKLVHFGADYIHCTRRESRSLLLRTKERLAARGAEVWAVAVSDAGYLLGPQEQTQRVYEAARRTHCTVGVA